MKVQVRQGTFETNSSSTHSLCINGENTLNLVKSLNVKFDSWGWEEDVIDTPDEKASYIYTAIYDRYYDEPELRDSLLNKFKETLESLCPNVTYEVYDENMWCGIDHSSEFGSDIQEIIEYGLLADLIFNQRSVIITGNDNDDEFQPDELYMTYKKIFYKGN